MLYPIAPCCSCLKGMAHTLSCSPLNLWRKMTSSYSLPPHTTHECQPLDVGLFGPLKKYWQQECHKFYQNNHAVVTKLNFNHMFQVVWFKAISLSNVCWGFRKSGVFPFNRDAVAIVVMRKVREIVFPMVMATLMVILSLSLSLSPLSHSLLPFPSMFIHVWGYTCTCISVIPTCFLN